MCEQVVWRTGDLGQDSCGERAAVEVTIYYKDGFVEHVWRLCSHHGKAAGLAAAQSGRDVDVRSAS